MKNKIKGGKILSTIIYIDGACKGNGNDDARAGWGATILKDSKVIEELSGKVPGKQTNNRAELQALLETLRYIEKNNISYAKVYSDSIVLVHGVTGKAKRKANRDIWEQIEAIFFRLRENDVVVNVEHIPREENKKADSLAQVAANSLI